jgi:putative SOS response-associated peptidase YedK
VAEHFHLDEVPALEARYNISPTQQVFAVRNTDEGREGVCLKWGLGPSWAADPSIGVKMLNARAETVAEKPAFRAAFLRRRCLIASDGFYEWRVSGKKKLPVHFHMRDGRLFLHGALVQKQHRLGAAPLAAAHLLQAALEVLVEVALRRAEGDSRQFGDLLVWQAVALQPRPATLRCTRGCGW